MRILIAGGGTGGHVIPALAIAREMRDQHGAEVRFVGTARGMETKLVPEAGFELELIRMGQLKGVSILTRLRTLADLPLGVLRCVGLLRSYRPEVVVGVGGYASGPAMMAAILLRIPTLAFEPNAVPGLANRIVGKYVGAAAVNFAPACEYFRNAVVTGVPVRPEFFAIPPRDPAAPPHLLVFGGSQGARALNEIMPRIAKDLFDSVPGLTLIHQAGRGNEASVRAGYAYASAPEARWSVSEFLSDMPAQFAQADLLLCRSGASTVAELAAASKPSVLVPFPRAADDHQRGNADVLVQAGAARMVQQADMTPEKLLGELRSLLGNRPLMEHMGRQARKLAHPEAVREIAAMIQRLAAR